MPFLLEEPAFKRLFGCRAGVTFRCEYDCSIGGCGMFVDKQVIIPGGQVEMAGKPLALVKKGALVSKVAADPHIRQSANGVAEILKGNDQGVVPYVFVKDSGLTEISAITQYDGNVAGELT